MFGLTKKECVIRVLDADLYYHDVYNVLVTLDVCINPFRFFDEEREIYWELKYPTCLFKYRDLQGERGKGLNKGEREFEKRMKDLAEGYWNIDPFGCNHRIQVGLKEYGAKWDQAFPEMQSFGGFKAFHDFQIKEPNTAGIMFLRESAAIAKEFKAKKDTVVQQMKIDYINTLEL